MKIEYKNKTSLLILLAFGIIIGILSYFLSSYTMRTYYTQSETIALRTTSPTIYSEYKPMAQTKTLKPQKYEIKIGSVNIESEDAEKDYEKIRDKVEELGGHIGFFEKYDGYFGIKVKAGFHIPSKDFESFLNWIVMNFNVWTTDIKLYTVSIEEKLEEIDLLQQTLEAYNKLMSQAELLSQNETKIDIILKITEKKFEIINSLKKHNDSIKEIEKDANYSRVFIEIRQVIE